MGAAIFLIECDKMRDSRKALVNARFYGRKSGIRFPHLGIIIDGNNIAAVCDESEIPESIHRIDMQGYNVAPGFIDL